MRKYFSFYILIAFVFISSCDISDHIAFDLNYNKEVTIPSIVGVNIPINLPTPPITTDINNKLSSKNSKKELISRAYLKELIIKSKDPSDQELGVIKNIEIFLKADKLDEVKIADKLNIPKNIGTKLELNIYDEIDIAKYIKKDTFNLRVRFTARKVVLHKIKIDINSVFKVYANIL